MAIKRTLQEWADFLGEYVTIDNNNDITTYSSKPELKTHTFDNGVTNEYWDDKYIESRIYDSYDFRDFDCYIEYPKVKWQDSLCKPANKPD